MKPTLIQRRLIVKPSRIHGYGVFAAEDIKKGQVIEECYVLPADKTVRTENYRFKSDYGSVLALGYGSIYNHADEPNAVFDFCLENSILVFSAIKLIKRGEEIYIHYGSKWFDEDRIRDKVLPSRRARSYFPLIKTVLRFSVVVTAAILLQKMIVAAEFFFK